MGAHTAFLRCLAASVAAIGAISASSGADRPHSPAPGTLKAPSHVVAPGAVEATPGARTLPALAQKPAAPTAGPAATNSIQAPMLAHCALGFTKTDENKNGSTGALYSFECTTPVITCPKNPVLPGASLQVEIISSNPEQSAKRIRYTCTYYPIEP